MGTCYQTKQSSPFEDRIARHSMVIRLLLGYLGVVIISTFSLHELRQILQEPFDLNILASLCVRVVVALCAAGWIFATTFELSTIKRWFDARASPLPAPTKLVPFGLSVIVLLALIILTSDSPRRCIWAIAVYATFDLIVGLCSAPLIRRMWQHANQRITECENSHPGEAEELAKYREGIRVIRDSMIGTMRFLVLGVVMGGSLTAAVLSLAWPDSAPEEVLSFAGGALLLLSSADAFARLLVRDAELHRIRPG